MSWFKKTKAEKTEYEKFCEQQEKSKIEEKKILEEPKKDPKPTPPDGWSRFPACKYSGCHFKLVNQLCPFDQHGIPHDMNIMPHKLDPLSSDLFKQFNKVENETELFMNFVEVMNKHPEHPTCKFLIPYSTSKLLITRKYDKFILERLLFELYKEINRVIQVWE